MKIWQQLRVAALVIGLGALVVPAWAGIGQGGKKGDSLQLTAAGLDAVVAARNGKRGGYGPGDGSGGGTRPQDGTGNGAKRGTCVKS